MNAYLKESKKTLKYLQTWYKHTHIHTVYVHACGSNSYGSDYLNEYIRISTYVSMYSHAIHKCMQQKTYIYMFERINACTDKNIYIYIYIYIFMHAEEILALTCDVCARNNINIHV